MLENMSFYKFMHRQILVLIALFAGTSISYVFFGYVYGSLFIETLWYLFVLLVSYWGYRLHKEYSETDLTIDEKENWLKRLRYFLFLYFSTWTIMFVFYVSKTNIELHYLAIFTQLGVAVVATTILVSEKRLVVLVLLASMLPITIYLFQIGEFYSYVIAFLTLVLAWVLLYAARNTYNYLQKSKYQAYHDYLTKLGNRHYFMELLDDAIKIQKQDSRFVSLLLIDLDHFKTINDTLGHDIGDELLIEVADRMRKISDSRKSVVTRLGGDEFCILSTADTSKEESLKSATESAQEILKEIKQTYIIQGHHLYISASIGVSIIDNPTMSAHTLIKEADIAMYEAKHQGRDGVIVFNEEISSRIERKLAVERFLHFAIKNDEITLNYQPQLNKDGKIIGCEVLARWINEELGFVSPDEFIPVAEETGLILELGHNVIEKSFQTLKSWSEKGIELEQLSINISMRQFFNSTFVDELKTLHSKYIGSNIKTKLVFEMTETTVADDISALISNMNKLRELGIHFSMDDFGTGYSSLSYLRQIPIDEIKIDKSFIFELNEMSEDKNIIKTILDIAKNLGLSTVAEGVETEYQKEFLIQESCDTLQGYYFSKPLSKDDFENYFFTYLKK